MSPWDLPPGRPPARITWGWALALFTPGPLALLAIVLLDSGVIR